MEILAWMDILTNDNHTVLYVGATNNLPTRHWEHKTKQNPKCFTAKYNVHKLVYFEEYDEVDAAFVREKIVKRKTRAWKIDLINSKNPQWLDLSKLFQ